MSQWRRSTKGLSSVTTDAPSVAYPGNRARLFQLGAIRKNIAASVMLFISTMPGLGVAGGLLTDRPRVTRVLSRLHLGRLVNPLGGVHFSLDPALAHLSHGTYGGCSGAVVRYQKRLVDQRAANPIDFNSRTVWPMIEAARGSLARLVGAQPSRHCFRTQCDDGGKHGTQQSGSACW